MVDSPGMLLVVMAWCVAGFLVLGFIVAWMLIYLSENGACRPVTVLWLIALPLLDTASVMVIRKLEGKSMFTPGRDHLHHHLLDAGLGARKSVLVMYVLAAAFGMAGLAGEPSGLPSKLRRTTRMGLATQAIAH